MRTSHLLTQNKLRYLTLFKLNSPLLLQLCQHSIQRIFGIILTQIQKNASLSLLKKSLFIQIPTGEGKTIIGLLTTLLNYKLYHLKIHNITTNHYLSLRDYKQALILFHFWGIQLKNQDFKEIHYSSYQDLCFNYLNCLLDHFHPIPFQFHYLLIDEVDYILIDKITTPLVISNSITQSEISKYLILLKQYDIKNKIELELLMWQFQFVLGFHFYSSLYHSLHRWQYSIQSLRRHFNYIIQDEIIILNHGRPMFGQRYSYGLQEALNIKENLNKKTINTSLTEIFYSTFIQNYKYISGFSGTLSTEYLWNNYGIQNLIVEIKNKKILENKIEIRHLNELVPFITQILSFKKTLLIITENLEDAIYLNVLLHDQFKLLLLTPFEIFSEENILKKAGQLNQIILTTQMIHRGTDISFQFPLLSKASGGLYIISYLPKKENEIIQIKGRTSRKNNPGLILFYSLKKDQIHSISSPSPIHLEHHLYIKKYILKQSFSSRIILSLLISFILKYRIQFTKVFLNSKTLWNEIYDLMIIIPLISGKYNLFIKYMVNKEWKKTLKKSSLFKKLLVLF